ncbi:DSD1 family PLP-dependent enzyme [Isosphaeraceae bacterium EP7]
MLLSPVGLTLDQLDSPALLLDLDAFEHNAAKMAGHLAERGIQWRPHSKAFKSPVIAHRLKCFGAIGVTVAKISEAEVMAQGGIDDILIAHLVVGQSKVRRLAALQRIADVKATVDHIDQVGPISRAAIEAGTTVGLLVDVDLGMGRTGVTSPEAAVKLARQVADAPGLRFDGVMGYEGHTVPMPDVVEKQAAIVAAIGRLNLAREAVNAAGLPTRIVSAGGTGSYQVTADLPGTTELQAGGGIFYCNYYSKVCQVVEHSPALTVLTTVVSRPRPGRAILDAGLKSMSEHRTPPTVKGHPDYRVVGLSAEHATVDLPEGADPRIGEFLELIPGYSDLTFVLHDRVLAHRRGRVEASWPIAGRGMLQ